MGSKRLLKKSVKKSIKKNKKLVKSKKEIYSNESISTNLINKFKNNFNWFIILFLVFITIINIFLLFSIINLIPSSNSNLDVNLVQTDLNIIESSPSFNYLTNSFTIGNPDAKITVVEFTDYTCGMSKRYFLDTYPSIKKEYIDTGKVKYVFKNYPLGNRAKAVLIAQSVECAGEQAKYIIMRQEIYNSTGVFDLNHLTFIADSINLDVNSFIFCVESERYASKITQDVSDAKQLGVGGTPTFFINDTKLAGAKDFIVFRDAIEKELKKFN